MSFSAGTGSLEGFSGLPPAGADGQVDPNAAMFLQSFNGASGSSSSTLEDYYWNLQRTYE